MGLEWPVSPQVFAGLVCLAARVVEGRIIEHVTRTHQASLRKLEASADHPGGPSKREGLASLRAVGMSGPWCEPRIHPATNIGMVNGSSISPTAGKLP